MQNTNHVIKYPYARLTGMREVMTWIQEPTWKPEKIDATLLKKFKMAKSKEFEAVHTLKFLGIITPEGKPTEEFDNLRKDYQGTLKRLVLEKYKSLFNILPARMINQDRLVSFFGLSKDTSEYQAKLFAWLCEQAGIELPNLEKHFHRSRFDNKAAQTT
jgi:hypothetical protein